MKFKILYLILLFCAPFFASAQSYVCRHKGQKVYTTDTARYKNCRAVQRSEKSVRAAGAGSVSAARSASEPAVQAASEPVQTVASVQASASEPVGFDTLSALLQQDITVSPVGEVPVSATPIGGLTASVVKPNLRREAAKIVDIPAPPPPPTRRQLLQKEIESEKAAMRMEVRRLNAAIGRGDTAQVQKLGAIIKDRQGNISSLEAELRR